MDFEQLKVIWDSQNDEPLYAVDGAALHAIVRRRKEQEHRRTAWCYGREIAINIVMGFVMFVGAGLLAWADRDWLQSLSWINVPVTPWHVAAFAVGGAIWIYCANHMWSARRRQLRREESMAATLHGDLERASAHIAFQIAIARSIVWWGLLPSWFAAGLSIVVVFHLKGAPSWAFAMMAVVMTAAFALALACQHYVVRLRYLPRQRELETLRAKLADQQR
jgi:hypothetical protein